mgnify:CR=1 FL=1
MAYDGDGFLFNYDAIFDNFEKIGKVPLSKVNMGFEPGEQAGSGKWEGAANGPDGAIWAVCHAAKRLLRITPATQAVELVGAEIAKARLSADFVGAELGPDGHLCAARSLQGPPEALH